MGLDVYLLNPVYSAGITHNLGVMARAVDIYNALWRPEEIGCYSASDIIEPLEKGLKLLKDEPETFKKLNSENGYGKYEDLVNFVSRYLDKCKLNPDAVIQVSR